MVGLRGIPPLIALEAPYRIISIRDLVVVVDVYEVKELLYYGAEEGGSEEALETCFALFDQAVLVYIQTIKEHLEDMNSFQVIELLNRNCSILVGVEVRQ